jgi:uncharacterized membrane protein YqhA
MLQRILSGSRYLVAIAVLGSFLTSVAVLAYGGVRSLAIVFDVFTHGTFTDDGAKHLSIESIELIDLFFLGTVLYIIALSLYELFINEHLPMPSWLVVTNLDDLKAKLLGVITVLLAVTFLANVVTWNGNVSILALGVAVGVVLFALAYLAKRTTKEHPLEAPVESNTEKGVLLLKKDVEKEEFSSDAAHPAETSTQAPDSL